MPPINALHPLQKLAVWKFSSCDGCQLSLLDCEDDLLVLADRLKVSYFAEASSEILPPPYDLSLVEGSISTPHEEDLIREVRRTSRYVVTIGACATSGGIQALRNFSSLETVARPVYPRPEWLHVLAHTTAIGAYIPVDYELAGCPIAKDQLLEVITAFLDQRAPQIPRESVCAQCKRRQIPCIAVAQGVTCLGPITQAGCGALCPAYGRGCYGCYGPKEHANVQSLAHWWETQDVPRAEILHALRLLHAWHPDLRAVSQQYDSR